MSNKAFSISSDFLFPLAAGAIAAMAVLPFSAIAFVVGVIAVLMKSRSRLCAGHARFAVVGLVASTVIFGGIVAAAALYRPAKVIEQQLQRTVNLPSTRLTLAELSYEAAYGRRSFPIQVSFCFADADKDIVVEWPHNDLTIGDFLAAIESQTVLRGRFVHCGNGYTVLGGGDCSFGLYVRDPQSAAPPFPGERFDVGEYAKIRGSETR